ncbi:MAG TPA: zinc-ribbon domain-containing protein [Pyrinomonadaceae bacterium]|nr:zinc-ribbon domain-containing protein [Pyrinomonadaceae bacterium]
MYCPKCGTQNADDASFCRGCGANVSLVPQALAGQAPARVATGEHASPDKRQGNDRERADSPNLSSAIRKIFIGIAFVLVALSVKNVYQIAGHMWWFWMLIPAAGSLGGGVAEFVRLRQESSRQQLPAANLYVPPAVSQAPHAAELPPRRVAPDIYRPASVTENTTKLLDKDQ